MNKLSGVLCKLFSNLILDKWVNYSWSQEGEDMLLRRIFSNKKCGFYVDVGAHHPKRFSNTYYFYRKGWTGINIDPMPNVMKLFNKFRPKDINLEIGVAEKKDLIHYYMFTEPALNSLSAERANSIVLSNSAYKQLRVIDIPVLPLCDVLDKYIAGRNIDFMSIDVEGYDLQVLRSNDWNLYRPQYVLVEVIGSNMSELSNDPIVKFMNAKKYSLFAKLKNTVIFNNTIGEDCVL